MRLLVIGDLHGDLKAARLALDHFAPQALLHVGDWGDPGTVDAGELQALADRVPIASTFGNHDPVELLRLVRNRDGQPILLEQGEVRSVAGLQVAAIGGIWARSHRLPSYVTDADVRESAEKIASQGPIDVLLTHTPPLGMADLTPRETHGGVRCFLLANQKVSPKFHFCGHLHRAQEYTMRDGRRVLNVGATPEGWAVLLESQAGGWQAWHERFERSQRP
jgi:Icc-related predicted phosphoesterase